MSHIGGGSAFFVRPIMHVLYCLLIWLICGLFFYMAFRALKTGRIKITRTDVCAVYERASFWYWFYTLLYSFIGLFGFWSGLYILFSSDF